MPDASIYSDVYWSTRDGKQIVARQWAVESPRGSVLVIHGIGDHSGRFEHVADHWNRNGYSVLAPDLRGHGRSDGKRGYIRSFDVLLDDVGDALQKSEADAIGQPAFLYGQSFGGLLAIYYTLKRQPELAGLIASSPPLRIAMPTPGWKVAIGKIIGAVCPTFSLNSGLDPNELSDDPQIASRVLSDRYRHTRITPGAFFGMLDAGQWCLENADRLTCPGLLLHGDKDRITDHTASIEFSESSSRCEAGIWPDGKHELHNMTIREDVLRKITDFQSRCIREDSPNKA